MQMIHRLEANHNNDKVEDKLQIVVHQARKDSQHHVYLQKKVWIVALGTIFRVTSCQEHRLLKLKQPLQKVYSILSKVKCSHPRHRHHHRHHRQQHQPQHQQHHHRHPGCRHQQHRQHQRQHRSKKYPIYKHSHRKNWQHQRRKVKAKGKEKNINTKKIYKNVFF